MKRIKILLIEDNRFLREETAALLNDQADIIAVSAAGNRSAIAKAEALVPDVVLLDIGLKSQNSLKVVALIKKLLPRTEVIVMDLIPTQTEVGEFIKAGVSGFVPKDATVADFLRTIRTVVKGVKVLPPTEADSLFSRVVESAIQEGKTQQVIDSVKLTKRELEVVVLLAEAKSIAAIARKLKIAVFTVKGHQRNILDKLALHTRLESLDPALVTAKRKPKSKQR